MTTEIINYDDQKTIATIKKMLAQNATPEEFALFIQFCKSTGLNPFKKEVWFIKGSGDKAKFQLMTGINGYWAIANNHQAFDGMELIESPDMLEIELPSNKSGVKKIRVPEWVESRIYRKDRKYPAVSRARWTEYSKSLVSEYGNLTIWGQLGSKMLEKCAHSGSLRISFPQELNGTYTAEEMPPEFGPVVLQPIPPTPLEAGQYLNKDNKKVEFDYRGDEVVVAKPEPTYYSIPEITFEQKTFLEKRGVQYDSDLGVWISPIDLGPKLAPYKIKEMTVQQLAELAKQSKQEQITLAIEEQRVESGEV